MTALLRATRAPLVDATWGRPHQGAAPRSALAVVVAAAANNNSVSNNTSSSPSSSQRPRRIIDTSRMSLKQQKALIATLKERELSSSEGSDSDGSRGGGKSRSGSSLPQLARKFRRPKATPEQRKAQRAREEEERSRDAATKGTTFALRNIYGTKAGSYPPVLLVDGYNVAFDWAKQKSSELTPTERARRDTATQSLDGVRQALLLDLCEFSQVAEVKVVVAFDAMMNKHTKGLEASQVAGVQVVFCGDRDADAFLMAEARRLSSEKGTNSNCPPRRVLVASSDREVQMFSVNCGFISSELLLKEMRRALRAADAAYRLKAATDASLARGLRSSLRPEAAGGLMALMFKLLDEEKEEQQRLLDEEERRRQKELQEQQGEAAAAARKQ